MRRFREYEAYIGMIYKAPAATLVLCTSIEISERICRGMGYTGESGIGYEGRGRQENAVRAVRIGS